MHNPKFHCVDCGKRLNLRNAETHECDGKPGLSDIEEGIDSCRNIRDIAPATLLREVDRKVLEQIAEEKDLHLEYIDGVAGELRQNKHFFKMDGGYGVVYTDGLFRSGNRICFDIDVSYEFRKKLIAGIFEYVLEKRKVTAKTDKKDGEENEGITVYTPRGFLLEQKSEETRQEYLEQYEDAIEIIETFYYSLIDDMMEENLRDVVLLVEACTGSFFNQLKVLDDKFFGDVDE